jgi:hypothetical protein
MTSEGFVSGVGLDSDLKVTTCSSGESILIEVDRSYYGNGSIG